jgi:YHS domain-containing protein
MLRLLLLATIIYLGYRLFKNYFLAIPKKGTDISTARSRRGEDMVLDPQCGTYLPRGDALEGRVAGEKHFFCSKECRKTYQSRHEG